MSTSLARLTKLAGIPFLAVAFLFAGLGSAAIADAMESGTNATEAAQSFAASFYLLAAILFLAMSIRFFVYKQRMNIPTLQ